MSSTSSAAISPGSHAVPRAAPAYARYAGARRVLDRLGDKWTLHVIAALDGGRLRFLELRDSVGGISNKVLTETLRTMERDGLVSRAVYAEIPPRVEYDLTDLGRALREPADAIARWAEQHLHEVHAARRRYDGL